MSELLSGSVEQELLKVSMERGVTFSSSYAFIRCPFHNNGNERRPSMVVNTSDPRFPLGFFNCFSCGEKGHWNILAKNLCLEEFDSVSLVQEGSLMTKLVLQKNISTCMQVPGLLWDIRKEWRGIKGNLLNKLESKLTFNFNTKAQELYIPCKQLDKELGGIYCLLEKSKYKSSYRNSSGPWVKSALFPYDYTRKLISEKYNYDTPVFIVEGPRDALNLLQNDIPALALLGCNNWTSRSINLLYILKSREVVVLMDGDSPGRKAAMKIKDDLDNSILEYKYSILNLPEGKDPGEMKGVALY